MRFCLFLVACLMFTGCRKKESAHSNTPAPEVTEPQGQTPENAVAPRVTATAPQPNAASPAEVPPEALVGAVHGFMTEQLHIFIQQTGRMPKDFREFASARMDSVPRPPPGMKYVVDTTTVEVKVVRQ